MISDEEIRKRLEAAGVHSNPSVKYGKGTEIEDCVCEETCDCDPCPCDTCNSCRYCLCCCQCSEDDDDEAEEEVDESEYYGEDEEE